MSIMKSRRVFFLAIWYDWFNTVIWWGLKSAGQVAECSDGISNILQNKSIIHDNGGEKDCKHLTSHTHGIKLPYLKCKGVTDSSLNDSLGP